MPINRTPSGGSGTSLTLTISGTVALGQTLTATRSAGYTGGLQWTRDGVDIAGATNSTYVLTNADTNKSIGCNSTVLITATAVAVGATAPVYSSSPVIIGTPTVGIPVAYTSGTYTGSTPITVTRQWLLDGNAISGATSATYTPISGDATHLLSVRETVTNVAGSDTRTSADIAVTASSGNSILLEDGTDLLLEDGTPLLLES